MLTEVAEGKNRIMQKYARSLVAELRRRQGLKQAALAEILGVSQGTLSRWERGDVKPSVAMEARLRDLLYKGPEVDVRRLTAEVASMFSVPSTGRNLTIGRHGKIIVHSRNGLNLKKGFELLPRCADILDRSVGEVLRDIESGTVIALHCLMENPAYVGESDEFIGTYYASNTISFVRTSIGIVTDTTYSLLSPEQWAAAGGKEQVRVVTLDDIDSLNPDDF